MGTEQVTVTPGSQLLLCHAAVSAYGGGAGGGSKTGARLPGPQHRAKIQQALDAITRVSKGFNSTLCTRTRPQLGEWLWMALGWQHTPAITTSFAVSVSVLDLHRPDVSFKSYLLPWTQGLVGLVKDVMPCQGTVQLPSQASCQCNQQSLAAICCLHMQLCPKSDDRAVGSKVAGL